MKRLHAFVLKSFTGPFLLTFFLVTFLLLMQFLWKYIDDLVGKGLEIPIISELLLYTSASLVPMSLPLAILLASLMTFGNLGEHYELIALKSSGVSLQRIMRPLMILSVMFSISAFLFANHVLPFTNLKMRTLLYDVQRQRPELQIKEGVFYNGIEGYSIKIGRKDPKTNLLHNVKIYDHTNARGNTSITIADSGYMMMTEDEGRLIITLYHGHNYIDIQENTRYTKQRTYPFRRDKFEEQIIILELSGFGLTRSDESIYKSNYQMMNIKQLMHYEDSILRNLILAQNQLNKHLQVKTIHYEPAQHQYRPPKKEDESKTIDPGPPIILDSLMNDIRLAEKRRIYSRALSFARNQKSHIVNTFNITDYKERRMRKYQIEKHRKFTLSVACFIFFFIGAPLGAIIRKGGLGMPVVISVLFFLLYHVLSLTGEKFVREGVLPDYQGMWISSTILLVAGSFLTYKATTDSVILNIDTYLSFFKKIFKIKLIKQPVKSSSKGNPS